VERLLNVFCKEIWSLTNESEIIWCMVIESEMVKRVERIVANNPLVGLKSMVANLAGSKIEC
jgi:hypothetical protein